MRHTRKRKKTKPRSEMRRYLDADRINATPVQGEENFYIDSTTFFHEDGRPFNIPIIQDKHGLRVDEEVLSSLGYTLPTNLKDFVIEYRLVHFEDFPHRLEIGRTRDPSRGAWSVNVSVHGKGYKLTIDAPTRHKVYGLLKSLREGTYFSWLDRQRKKHRVHLDHRRQQRSPPPPKTRGRRHEGSYRRPGRDGIRRLVQDELEEDSEVALSA